MKKITRLLFISALIGAAFFCLPASAQNCCGTIDQSGIELAAELDASGVDRLWIAGHHVNWKTGEPDLGAKPARSHCSAFAAAFAQRRGAYLLRPPEHSQVLLATAQLDWLSTEEATKEGWRRVSDMREAQRLANEGKLVVAAFPSPNPKKPGHIAIVRPAEKTLEQLKDEGPQITQAGEENALSTTAKDGFRHHKGAWPDGIFYFVYR